MKILITLGATAEAIDGVRFITNFSSGATGSFLADSLHKQGHKVLALCAKTAKYLPSSCRKDFFTDFNSLDKLIKKSLKKENFDLIIHLAAVSDFSPKVIICGDKKLLPKDVKKLPSDKDLQIVLKSNFKIVERIKDYVRVTIGTKEQMDKFIEAAGLILAEEGYADGRNFKKN